MVKQSETSAVESGGGAADASDLGSSKSLTLPFIRWLTYKCAETRNENSEDEELGEMSGEMDGSLMEGEEAEGEETKKPQAEVELVDSRPKKLTGIELIKENVKELHEVIAYMDYSFERAFTIQEKQFMLAYKVSGFKFPL